MVPVIEHGTCQFRTGVQIVLSNQFVQFFSVTGLFDQ